MGKVAILKILQENQEREFIVFLEIKEDDGRSLVEIEGTLSINNKLHNKYRAWKNSYQDLISCSRNDGEWEIHSIPSNIAYSDLIENCRQKLQSLEEEMKQWLASANNSKWNKIREELAKKLDSNLEDNQIKLIIKTKYTQLWKLPWHVWDLLKDYPDLGIGCSWSEHYKPSKQIITHNKVRILAIFGETTNINLEPDREAIKQLPNTELEFIEQPNSGALINNIRQINGWDILFFCGHSQTKKERGRIYINERENITVEEFKNALQEAIAKGLKIAIFNSCDGLALARELVAEFHIPVVIVMQEIVPDRVAQCFVREFLTEYSNGKSLYTAVRRAQNRLEQFSEFPGVTLLPLIVQNDAIKLPSWSNLLPLKFPKETQSQEAIKSPYPKKYSKFGQLILSSLAVSAMVIGMRWLGILQPLELYAYDRLVQLQSSKEKTDPRILVVTVDEEDIKYQDSQNMKRMGSLSDEALDRALDEVETLNPITIALDIYRPSGFASEIVNRIKTDNRFFAICKIQELNSDRYSDGVEPPPELPQERLVFSDIPVDKYNVVRRQFLDMTSLNASDPCNTQLSLSFLVAQHYLYQKHNIKATHTNKKEWKLGNVVLKKLRNHSAGYHALDDSGYQILLKYRRGNSLQQVAHSISLTKLIEQGISSSFKERIQEPIILIGNTDKSYKDYHFTPYSSDEEKDQQKSIPGVFLQAQMTSQILSAVLDNRPLIWYWNPGREIIWIFFWSIIGGLLAIYIFNPWRLLVNIIGSLLGIITLCFVIFTYSGWIPLIPAVIALLITIFIVRKRLVNINR